jgi:hypothetical protein
MRLGISLTVGADPAALLAGLVRLGIADMESPVRSSVRVGIRRASLTDFWTAWREVPPLRRAFASCKHDEEGDRYSMLSWDPDSCAKVKNTDYPFAPASLRDLLAPLDFTVASVLLAHFYPWRHPKDYKRPGLGDGHFGAGSFAAFRGEDGHRRLVSRRWLDHGPWRLIRDEATDLTLVQYHDLDADEATALEQAKLGHQTMGIRPHGGFIQKRFVWGRLEPNFYDRQRRTSIVLVHHDDPVAPRQMLEAAALKLWQPHEDTPIDQVAFVFTKEANARKHLRDLWLRGLEVRVMGTHGEVRIDDTYDPGPPEVPDWVQAVQDREGF